MPGQRFDLLRPLKLAPKIPFPNREHQAFRCELAEILTRLITERELTQKQAAEILHTDPSRISDLQNGHLQSFSTDILIHYLRTLGCKVEVRICTDPLPKDKRYYHAVRTTLAKESRQLAHA